MFWPTEDPFTPGYGGDGYGGYSKPQRRRAAATQQPYPLQSHNSPISFYPSRRSQHQYEMERRQAAAAWEEELLRRQLYQHEMDQRAVAACEQQAWSRELHRRRALAQREHQIAAAAEKAQRQRQRQRRLAMITYTVAARKIQRWWRAADAARKAAVAAKVAEALQRNLAVRQARKVTQSLERLAEFEAKIESLPEATAKELSERVSSKGISVFEHTLEKLVLSADDIPTHGSDAARAIRKRLVKTANTRLQAFDDKVVAAAAAEAEREAEQEAEVDTDDEATAGSENGESDVSMSPAAEVPEVPGVIPEVSEGEWVAMETESQPDDVTTPATTPATTPTTPISPIVEEETATGSPTSPVPPSPPQETQPLLQKSSASPCPRDKFLGMSATILTSHDASKDDADIDEEDPVGEENLDNAAVADLIAPRAPLTDSSQRSYRLGRDVPSTSDGQDSEIDSDSDSDSEHSFVEVHAESAQSEDEEEGEAFRCMYAKKSSDRQ